MKAFLECLSISKERFIGIHLTTCLGPLHLIAQRVGHHARARSHLGRVSIHVSGINGRPGAPRSCFADLSTATGIRQQHQHEHWYKRRLSNVANTVVVGDGQRRIISRPRPLSRVSRLGFSVPGDGGSSLCIPLRSDAAPARL